MWFDLVRYKYMGSHDSARLFFLKYLETLKDGPNTFFGILQAKLNIANLNIFINNLFYYIYFTFDEQL